MTQALQDERSIFLNAVQIGAEEDRRAYLESACRDAPTLRSRVEALLREHEKPQPLLDQDELGPTIDAPIVAEKPGTQIGPYKLREQIGEGGFGVVYVAEQEKPVARKVALKIIKPGMDTKDVVARFEAERQVLALMDHPNVAKVLDAGATESGRPYFVMELVKGVPITEFCDERKLSTRERLHLFIDVCRAVQHAHQKGIIHRDIKPSNVMVTLHDDQPVVQVIDFGVAKALSSKLTEKTVYTAYGQMVGTPLYMSPEQAQFSGLDVDTRSDVYSLGVLLYELLTGTTPFDKETLKTAGFDEMRRIIREDDPPRPSARISTLQAEQLSTVSGRRKVDAKKLSHSLRGELDWIVMKALEKDRNRRYESASAFTADVERFLNKEPVQARPMSGWYRVRKFASRHKLPLTSAALVALALILGIVGTTWQAILASEEARRASQAETLAEERFREADRQRRAADTQARRANNALKLGRRAVQFALDDVVPVLKHRSDEDAEDLRMEMVFKSIAFFSELIRLEPKVPTNYRHRAEALLIFGADDRALADCNTAIRLKPADMGAYRLRGMAWMNLGNHDKAIADYNQILRIRPNDKFTLGLRGEAWREKGNHDKAIADITKAIRLGLSTAKAYYDRGTAWLMKANYKKAILDFDKAIGIDPTGFQCISNRGNAWYALNEYAKATSDYMRAVQLAPDEPLNLANQAWLMATCPDRRFRNGKSALELSKAACEITLSRDGYYLRTLAAAYAETGNFTMAVKIQKRAISFASEDERSDYRAYLMLYEKGKPLRQRGSKSIPAKEKQ